MSDISSILDLIKQTEQESTYDIFIPSLGKSLKFLPMKASDQKELVKALVDSPFYSAMFNVKMFSIINNTLLPGQNINVGDLSSYDRQWINIQLRSHNVSVDYEEEFDYKLEYDSANTKEKFKKSINLLDHLEKKKSNKIPAPVEIIDGDFSLIIGFPNLAAETALEQYISDKVFNIDENNPKSIKSIIAVYYIVNIIKYIKAMKIKSKEIPFEMLPINDKLSIAESLPTTLTRKIISKIDELYGKAVSDILEYTFTKNKNSYTGTINVDNTFFVAN